MYHSDEYTMESSDSTVRLFTDQQNDQYLNLDVYQIKKKISPTERYYYEPCTKQRDAPDELALIPVKNQIKSLWTAENDSLFIEATKKNGENTNFADILHLFPGETVKSLKYHFYVLNQVWNIEQYSKLLEMVYEYIREHGEPNFEEISHELGKTRTYCKKHYEKLVYNCFTSEMDYKIMGLCADCFEKLRDDTLAASDFASLQHDMLIPKQHLYARYVSLRQKSADFDKFWFKKDAYVFRQWWNANGMLPNSERRWDDIFTTLTEYTIFDVCRYLQNGCKY